MKLSSTCEIAAYDPLKNLGKPIRMPVQARSAYTVKAIFEATVQVLIQLGINQLTTTKVADRAGV